MTDKPAILRDEVMHTPTPWEAVPQNGAGPMIARRYETGNQMSPVGLRLICHVLQRGNSLAEDEANARFIVTACNSYEAMKAALELALRSIEHAKDSLGLVTDTDEVIREALNQTGATKI